MAECFFLFIVSIIVIINQKAQGELRMKIKTIRASRAMSVDLTPEQRENARHALGLNGRRKESYRNHFVTGPGSDDYDSWMELVLEGYAYHRLGSATSGGNDIFWLKKKTALAVLDAGERLSEDFR